MARKLLKLLFRLRDPPSEEAFLHFTRCATSLLHSCLCSLNNICRGVGLGDCVFYFNQIFELSTGQHFGIVVCDHRWVVDERMDSGF